MLAASRTEGRRAGFESNAYAHSTARRSTMTKSATKEGTTRYAQKFAGRAAEGHFRETQRLLLSSLGIGTYLGQPDDRTDAAYAAAAVAAGGSGTHRVGGPVQYRVYSREPSPCA